MLHKLYYISQGSSVAKQENDIREALEAGCKLIQLRFKTTDEDELLALAVRIKKLCQDHQATFIINDNVKIAKLVDADGVHLGLDDLSIKEARNILGISKIIGGTANNLTDVLQRITEKCDYIGLGPLRFTSTKEKLSPLLGISGYQEIIEHLSTQNINIPIYAIGGVELKDVVELQTVGVYGIALSGAISNASNKSEAVATFNQKLN